MIRKLSKNISRAFMASWFRIKSLGYFCIGYKLKSIVGESEWCI
ncbi:hypothetical protein [Bacillus sp. FSL K6-0067]